MPRDKLHGVSGEVEVPELPGMLERDGVRYLGEGIKPLKLSDTIL